MNKLSTPMIVFKSVHGKKLFNKLKKYHKKCIDVVCETQVNSWTNTYIMNYWIYNVLNPYMNGNIDKKINS